MGTRNITKVVHGGKVKLCQYGQWDGYPTITGVEVLEFVKNGDFEALKECHLSVLDDNTTTTGFPKNATLKTMFDVEQTIMFGGDLSYEERKEKCRKELIQEFGEDNFVKFLLASRDTGAEILKEIKKPVKTYAQAYVYQLEKPDWQIEAINVINLDKEEVLMMWHDQEMTIPFSAISSMDIYKAMEEFEKDDEDEFE